MADPLFELKQVHYSYLGDIPALCGVTLAIGKGERAAVIGANGTGKSTLLMMLDALLFPRQGTLEIFGKEVREEDLGDAEYSRFLRSRIGFVFQNPEVQLFCPTVREDIAFGPLHLGVEAGEIERRIEKMVSALRIGHLLGRAPHELSLGEKKKVAIASVLAIEPEVLLLDEPTSGLDPQTTRDIVDIILAEHEAGKTIVTATQDLHIMCEIADKVHVFDAEKKITRSASCEEILSDGAFLQAHNLVHVHRHRHQGIAHSHPHRHLDHHT